MRTSFHGPFFACLFFLCIPFVGRCDAQITIKDLENGMRSNIRTAQEYLKGRLISFEAIESCDPSILDRMDNAIALVRARNNATEHEWVSRYLSAAAESLEGSRRVAMNRRRACQFLLDEPGWICRHVTGRERWWQVGRLLEDSGDAKNVPDSLLDVRFSTRKMAITRFSVFNKYLEWVRSQASPSDDVDLAKYFPALPIPLPRVENQPTPIVNSVLDRLIIGNEVQWDHESLAVNGRMVQAVLHRKLADQGEGIQHWEAVEVQFDLERGCMPVSIRSGSFLKAQDRSFKARLESCWTETIELELVQLDNGAWIPGTVVKKVADVAPSAADIDWMENTTANFFDIYTDYLDRPVKNRDEQVFLFTETVRFLGADESIGDDTNEEWYLPEVPAGCHRIIDRIAGSDQVNGAFANKVILEAIPGREADTGAQSGQYIFGSFWVFAVIATISLTALYWNTKKTSSHCDRDVKPEILS